MEHRELAMQLFQEGYNCAQAVLCAFSDMTGLERGEAAKLASSFGGGIGRMREVCGTVSGAMMAFGCLRGYADPKDPDAKKAHYAAVQEFARRFRERNGSIVCRELLAGVKTAPGGIPEERTEAFYKKRPCVQLVGDAAEILGQLLAETE